MMLAARLAAFMRCESSSRLAVGLLRRSLLRFLDFLCLGFHLQAPLDADSIDNRS
ncbi:MAG: hypothetical protein Q8M03_07065 [Legionella sp.]|nr:hypothetical protein [Legionella sp.]